MWERQIKAKSISVIICLLFVASFSCSKTNSTQVRFGYQPFGSNIAFFIAMQKGFFSKRGLNVEPVKIVSANDAATAMINGDIVGNATLPLNVLLNIEENQPGLFKIFMIKASSKNAWSDYLLVPAGSEIKSMEDLAGKRVGSYPGSAQKALLKLILSKFVNKEAPSLVELPPSIQLQALESGQIDALLTYDQLALIALERGIARVLMGNPIGKHVIDPLYGFPYVMSSEFVKKYPLTAKKIRDAMYEAVDFLHTNEKAARETMVKWSDTTPEIAAKVNLWDQVKGEDIDKAALQRLADIFYASGVVGKKIDCSSLYLTKIMLE